MKKLFLGLLLIFSPLAFVACSTAPSERVVAVQTLKAVGQSAEATVALSAQLYRDGRITAKQAILVKDFYDYKFQPAYRFAVTAVQANVDSIASPEVIAVASELSSLLLSFQK